MSTIASYENDNPYKPASLKEALAFWKYICKKAPVSIILYFLSFVVLLVLFGWISQMLFGNIIHADISIALAAAPILLLTLFFSFPSLPRVYKFQFKGKMRPGIPEEELTEIILDMIRKSLELAAVVIITMGVLSVIVFSIAKFLGLPDVVTLVLVVATAFNTFLGSLVFFSLGKYNMDILKKIFVEEESRRYTSLGQYKRIFVILGIFDSMMLAFLVYIGTNGQNIWMTAIILIAIIVNIFLVLGLWNYREMKGKSEEERNAVLPQMRRPLSVLALVDILLVAAFAVHKIWAGVSYERAVLALFTIVSLSAGVLAILWSILKFAEWLRKAKT